jgi:hypothetical protein
MADPGDFVTDYDLSFAPMAELGWTAETVAWRKPQDWDAFDAVYLCTPWDYPQHPADFMRVLERIDASRAVLLNDIAIVRWNLDKSYLRDLEERGDAIVPSHWLEQFAARDVLAAFTEFGVDKLVVKPTIGGNAVDTFVLEDPPPADLLARLETLFVARACIVQPFMENILEEGEYSLFFFNGEYSHAIRKVPRPGDFRVQEEHGADIMPVTPPQALLDTARTVFSHVEPLPVYGRGDWVRGPDGRFLLMELELIEPSLYLRTDSGAAARFARAFDQRFQELAGK